MPTPIEWCDETFNPWWGCERVSPGCAHCYADTFARRLGMDRLWTETSLGVGNGSHGFRFFGDAHWQEPLRWARTLPAKLGRRPRIFCASMADVFEDRPELDEHRFRLFRLIKETPELDWLILTKRPEAARDWLALASFGDRQEPVGWVPWNEQPLPNVWIGVSIENARYTWRADVLREIPAAVRFISAEPLLGSLYDGSRDVGQGEVRAGARRVEGLAPGGLRADHAADPPLARPAAASIAAPVRLAQQVGRAPLDLSGIDWVIIGGESGPHARPFHLDHARQLIGHAVAESYHRTDFNDDAAVAVFVKQLGARPVDGDASLQLRDRKGGDPDEWPADLRIREFPRTAVHA